MVNHDTNLYIESVKLEESFKTTGIKEGLISFKHFFLALDSFWFIYFYIFLSYKLVNFLMGTMNSIGGFVLALILVALFEIVANFIILDTTLAVESIKTWQFVPFRGLIKFVSVLLAVIVPTTDYLINKTNTSVIA